VGRIRRLDERDGLREGGDVAREDARDILVGGECALLAPREVRAYDRLVFNTFEWTRNPLPRAEREKSSRDVSLKELPQTEKE